MLCGLNPCFNGRYSRRQTILKTLIITMVLILVLMEDTLGAIGIASKENRNGS
ncbi:hypothetical protein HMPREF9148_01150 [Prevotella sp. F0091]|nr:hypothetical protein HMPREF9148_01150 [Prevotella sp. F0091]